MMKLHQQINLYLSLLSTRVIEKEGSKWGSSSIAFAPLHMTVVAIVSASKGGNHGSS
jgi:hypothetical protein